MKRHRYLILGGGMTGHAAARGIREVDPSGEITLLAEEADPPYSRPPLSKGLWLGKPLERIWLEPVAGLEIVTSRRAVRLNTAAREVVDSAGEVHHYAELLLATGGSPRRLPFGGDRVCYYRTLADYRRLRAATGHRVAVIGGGFIGSEIAAALAANDKEVTMLFPEAAIGALTYPADLAHFLGRFYADKGVQVWPGEQVTGIEPAGDATKVRTAAGKEVVADLVVAGIGIAPNTALAESAGLEVSDGIRVDAHLRTSAPHVFAAGDVARFESPALGGWVRIEHEDNALTMGREAGRSMAGAPVEYRHLPFFYSDLFDLGYEAVGRLDSRLETISSWKTPFREGVVYYLEGARVRGVLLWNTWGKVDAARALITGEHAFRREALDAALAP